MNTTAKRYTPVKQFFVAHFPSMGFWLTTPVLADWAEKHGVFLEFIQPGKPTKNSFIERFNRTYRNEVLVFYLFKTLNEVREVTWKLMKEYNEERPHEALGDMSPLDYKMLKKKPENSNLYWC